MQFKPEYKFSSKKQTLFVSWFISHRVILNELSWFESGIWSPVAPAWLARRKTIANAKQSKLKSALFSSYSRSIELNWLSNSLNEYFNEWVHHWISTSLNEYFTERVLNWLSTSLNEYFTVWVLHWIST